MTRPPLSWQSKTVQILVFPAVAVSLLFEGHWWILQLPLVALWTLGLSALLGLAAWKSHSATPGAALAGAAITACLIFSTASVPYLPWRSALVPVLVVLLLTSAATRLGRPRKLHLGTAESRRGRVAAQVAANLGAAALISNGVVQSWLIAHGLFPLSRVGTAALAAAGIAALAEAAADTVSSELGQVLSPRPRMITTLRRVPPGTDGAFSLRGTAAGIAAAAIVAVAGAAALRTGASALFAALGGAIFGLFFDSLLGATLERRGWLNNDAVNFLSTVSAAACALALLALLPPAGIA